MAKTDKQELREPDALQRAGLEAKSWIEGKEKLILGLVGGLLALGLVIALVGWMKDRSERQAQKELGAALKPLTREVADPATPPPPELTGEDKPFASQKEQDEALVTSLTAFRSEHGGTRSATTAAYTLAHAQLRLGKHDEAIQLFSEFLEKAPKDDALRAAALEGQGYAYEAKGDLEKALASFDQMAQVEAKDFLDGMGSFHKARVLILQGKKDEAAKALSEIPGNFPNSAAARMATERMNLLASQGVKVPPPAPPKASATDGGTIVGSGS